MKEPTQEDLHILGANDTKASLLKQNDVIQCVQSNSVINESLVVSSQDSNGFLAFCKNILVIGFCDDDIWAVDLQSILDMTQLVGLSTQKSLQDTNSVCERSLHKYREAGTDPYKVIGNKRSYPARQPKLRGGHCLRCCMIDMNWISVDWEDQFLKKVSDTYAYLPTFVQYIRNHSWGRIYM